MPDCIPLYELDYSVVIHPGEPVPEYGIYLPEIDNAAAQFLHPGRWQPEKPGIWVRQGLKANQYNEWIDDQKVYPSTWTLVRRVPERFIAVPPEGFYPKNKPSSGRVEAGQPCPQAGLWWTPAKPDARRAFAQGEVMPDFPNSRYGATIWYREAE